MSDFFVDDLDDCAILEMDTGVRWRVRDTGESGVNDRVCLTEVRTYRSGLFSKDGLQRMYDDGVLEVV